MAHGGSQTPLASPPPASAPRPRDLPTSSTPSESAQSKRDLASWWRNFRGGNAKLEESRVSSGIFGIPLDQSIRYANVAISLFNDEGQSYIYGYVPIVVAKCGVFLKEKATETEGIFRLAGSEKRIKELKTTFDQPPRYGKGLDWTGYTVHDAANILRRYLNQLPEPIIPLDFYERFRQPLRNHQQEAVGQQESQRPDKEGGGFDADKAIRSYQALITELPPLNRQLLLYILDLLAVFASKSNLNKMTNPNLAAIFQPGLLSHPQHDMAPQEYRLSQDVLIFLIENQDSFLIGMHGTAADEQTVRDVQSGYQPKSQTGSPTGGPSRSKTVIGRSASNASAGQEGGRRLSSIRRNLSTSSRNSRKSSVHGGGSPAVGSPSLGAGVHRSNTVPSQRPAGTSPRFTARERPSDPPTPSSTLPPAISPIVSEETGQKTPVAAAQATTFLHAPGQPEITSASSSEATTPLAAPGSDNSSAILIPKGGLQRGGNQHLLAPETTWQDASHERSLSGSQPRNFLDILRKSPGIESERKDQRQPRKLQKRRTPGSTLSSAHSSAADLGEDYDDANDSVASPTTPNVREIDPMSEARPEPTSYHTAQSSLKEPQIPRAEAMRSHSPNQSVQSMASTAGDSDGEFIDEAAAKEKQEKKKRWRFSHSAKSKHAPSASESGQDFAKSIPPVPPLTPQKLPPVSSTTGAVAVGSADASRNNSSAQPIGEPPSITGTGGASPPDQAVLSDSDDRKKGPMSWIKGKIQERKEKEAEKRAKSPTGHGQHHGHGHGHGNNHDKEKGESRQRSESLADRPKSVDVPRQEGTPVEAAKADAVVTPRAAESKMTETQPPAVAVAEDKTPTEQQQSKT